MELPPKDPHQKRVVIAGAGFAGLTLARKLKNSNFQVVLLDKNNYHQFQPLLYQVATAGLEPSSISFPLRKIFQQQKNLFIRIATIHSVDLEQKFVCTNIGTLNYDYLVLAQGAETNFYGMDDLQQHAYAMKSVSEALLLRNTLLQHYEQALTAKSEAEREALLNIVIVGGGPTGVELAGAIAEMKNKILPRDYAELNFAKMKVYLVEAAPQLLGGMSAVSQKRVKNYLGKLKVNVLAGTSVQEYDGNTAQLSNGRNIHTHCLVWAAGVRGNILKGLPKVLVQGGRVLVDDFNRLQGHQDVFAIGDVALMRSGDRPKGHPQVAPAAIQQASLLAKNLQRLEAEKSLLPFRYRDKGAMATVGRHLAVAEAAGIKLKGATAWFAWMLVHLMSIIGIKNRLLILLNWTWQYFTYDQSLRLIIKPSETKQKKYEKGTDPVIAGSHLVGM
ncbi:MAG: NAD(P)/FAD-dependent oxidoreductase [Flavisolibacter sp.]